MKRIIALLLILTFAIGFAACGAKNENAADPSGKQTEAAPESGANGGEIAIGDHTVRLTDELRHGDLRFLAPEKAEKAGYDQVYSLCSRVGEDVLFTISIVYFKGKDVDEVMSGSDYNMTDRTAGGLTYRYFEDSEDGTAEHTYVRYFNGTTYAISFVSDFDTAALETAFLANVRFEKE